MRIITRQDIIKCRELLGHGEGGHVIGLELEMSQKDVGRCIRLAEDIQPLVDQGYQFYCSHSGGKDSQAMYQQLCALIPRHQITVIHADLGEVEWQGVQQHIASTITHPMNVCKAIWADGSDKELLDMVEKRGQWPSPAMRQCTSDLKRGPIQKFIRNDMKQRGLQLAVNCMGLRAEESTARSKLEELKPNKMLSKAGRTVCDWLPIHDWMTGDVFDAIEAAGQQPHWAYSEGNERLSCMFCIMGSTNDLRNAARLNPVLAEKYLRIERETGHTFFHKKTLASVIATDA